MNKAILLLNLGGPETLDDVQPFLYRLFADPEIIRVPFAPARYFFAYALSRFREKKSRQMYEKIGGGSPIRRLTEAQAKGVGELLKARGLQAHVRTAFSCSEPLVEHVVKELAEGGVQDFMSLPLYPHYSLTTTKGSFDRVRRAVRRFAPQGSLVEIPSYPAHPLFIGAHADLVEKETRKFSGSEPIHLLFSAHSIPQKLVSEEQDPYPYHIEKSAQAIVAKVGWKNSWSVSWQSKLGPIQWLEPSTEDVLVSLGRQGVKRVLVVPIAFVTDHIETLKEIDIDFKRTAQEAGVTEFHRTPGLNNHPLFLQCLTELAAGQKGFWGNGTKPPTHHHPSESRGSGIRN